MKWSVAIIIILSVIIVIALIGALSVKSYDACGCGQCGGDDSKIIKFTFNPEKIIQNDQAIKNSEFCRFAGCGKCVKYYYFGLLK